MTFLTGVIRIPFIKFNRTLFYTSENSNTFFMSIISRFTYITRGLSTLGTTCITLYT